MGDLYTESIEKNLNKTLEDKIIYHRKAFVKLFKARYMEMIPSLIHYKNKHTVSVDFSKVEIALRGGYDVVLGNTTKGNIQVVGFTKGRETVGNPNNLFGTHLLNERDIEFLIPPHLREKSYKEISDYDKCETGNFVVLRNKNLNYIQDYFILDHYIRELSEIVVSRYSLSMQIKVTTFFLSKIGDESMNVIISQLYNGNPAIKVGELFEPDEQIIHMNNDNIASIFQELKREYQNKISELNNMLGMNALAVEKESGVSDEEVKGNRAYTTSNANIYLDGRNHGLEKLNKRYGLHLEAMYNDEVVSEFSKLGRIETLKEGGKDE